MSNSVNTRITKPMPYAVILKTFACLLFSSFLFTNNAFAEAVGGKNGYLQAISSEAFEAEVHQRLIKKIRIDNPQPYTEKDSHWHYRMRSCAKAINHSHNGKRKHQHSYNCNNKTVKSGRAQDNVRTLQSHQQTESASPRVAVPVMALSKTAPKPQASTTNLQEAGVDEADFVKTDGRYIYAIANGNYRTIPSGIRIFDTNTGANQPKQIGVIGFEKNIVLSGMYLVPDKNRLIILGNTHRRTLRKTTRFRFWSSESNIITVDISNKTKPKVIQHVRFDGNSRSTRRIGNKLYLVISSNGLAYPSTYEYKETMRKMTPDQMANVRNTVINKIKKWSLKDAMPNYRVVGKTSSKILNNNSRVMQSPDAENGYTLTTLLTINLAAENFQFDALHYVGYVGTIYASNKALYITQSVSHRGFPKRLDQNRFPRGYARSLVHKFSYTNNGLDYRGSGAVLGNLGWSSKNAFQLDEDNKGNLRAVAQNWQANITKYSDPATKSPVILTVLAEHPQHKQLITLSRLPNHKNPKPLGKKGESLYATRLFNDYAYFITFRRTDPLYIVDLRNPRNMVVTGELEIPGFSDYLHPINSKLLMGVGKEADKDGRVEGLKLSLFDISNPRLPREVDKIQLGKRGTHSPANHNHHAFTSLKMSNSPITRVSLPIHLVENDKTYRGKQGLHQFEVNAQTHKIRQVGKLAPPKTKQRVWAWNAQDRSIIIDNKVYYYKNGRIWAGTWGAK